MNVFLCIILLIWYVYAWSCWKSHVMLYPFTLLLSLYILCYMVIHIFLIWGVREGEEGSGDYIY